MPMKVSVIGKLPTADTPPVSDFHSDNKQKSYGTLIVTRRCAGLAVDMQMGGVREEL